MGKWEMQVCSLRLVLKSLAIWVASALFFLAAAAFILSKTGTGSSILGYVSSGISFLCAIAAGLVAAENRGDRPMLQGLFTAFVLVVFLLTLGFLIGKQGLEPSGVLSLVTFTISGVLVGTLFLARGRKRRRTRSAKFRRIS